MRWIAPTEKDTAAVTPETRLWDSASLTIYDRNASRQHFRLWTLIHMESARNATFDLRADNGYG